MSLLFAKILYAAAITVGGIVLFYVLFFLIKKWSKDQKRFFPTLIDKHLHVAGVMMFAVITFNIDFTLFKEYIALGVYIKLKHLLHIFLIISIGYLLVKLAEFLKDIIISIYSKRQSKDYTLRGVRTQYQLMSRILKLVITIATTLAVLMTFAQFRQFSGAVLASASVAGLVLGFAAQKSLGTIFAGIQIAMTRSIKLDDYVTVADTEGTVGEITLTYVVINTWDDKRKIVPINFFIDNSFQNWTRVNPEVVCQVKLNVNYSLPLKEVRQEFNRWLKETDLWDKRKSSLTFSDVTNDRLVLRARMSAATPDNAGDLEALIREKLILLLQENYPWTLPGGPPKPVEEKMEKHN